MQRIAIITVSHSEASTCLALHLAKLPDVKVDFYYFETVRHGTGKYTGFQFWRAPKKIGISKLETFEIPEITELAKNDPINFYVIRVYGLPHFLKFVDYWMLYFYACQISWKHYDAINLCGQQNWVMPLHNGLKKSNLIHSFHEIGNHMTCEYGTPVTKQAIVDNCKVVLFSDSIYKQYCSFLGVKKEMVAMIPFGKFETTLIYAKDIDMKLPFDSSKPLLLFFGLIRPYKGLDLLANAIDKLKDRLNEFNIVIAGKGNSEYLQYFRRLPNCHVINRRLSNDELVFLNKQATAVVLPYHSASQSGIIPTTFLFGNPVIATKVGSFVDNIKDGFDGILVEPDNPQDLADAIIRLMTDRALEEHLREGVRAFGKGDKYDWDLIAKSSYDFFLK